MHRRRNGFSTVLAVSRATECFRMQLCYLGPGFYGVTHVGGANGRGTVFQLTPPGSGGDWSETILYSFTGSGDAAFPSSDLVMDEAGNLYGTALVGGVNDLGAVYQLSPPANEGEDWTETVIFSFSGPDGTLPFGRLQFDQNGPLYGTTDGGGALQGGTVFQLMPPAQAGTSWTENVLFNFSGGKTVVIPWRELLSTIRASSLERPLREAAAAGLWGSDFQADSATEPGRSVDRDRSSLVWRT